MVETSQKGQDQESSASIPNLVGDRHLPDNRKDKPKKERIVSTNPSTNARSTSRSQTPVNSSNNLTALDPAYFYGGYDDGSYNHLQLMSQAMYNDNSSLLYHPAYGFDPQVAFGQFSPVMIDGQLYSPSYYTQPVSPTDLPTQASISQEGLGENVFFDPGSGYYFHYPMSNNSLGFYNGSRESVSNQSTPGGILGPYQQTQYHGYRDSVSLTTSDSNAATSERNRGPRALKPKGSNSADNTSTPIDNLYNQPDFVTTYDKAKFFVIKSFTEDNVHRSIKYGVWASTASGNRKLDAAFKETKETGDICPIFLFFSVNASGQFCGVAEMIGPVDFENNADYWQQDRWSGQFRVKWHIIKDVPNTLLRHIILDNNDHKPVTHSRDSQEVKLEKGIEMLKIFKEHDADTSLLEDFEFYDEREKFSEEKRDKEQVSSAKNSVDDVSVNQLSEKVADSLHLEKHKEAQ
ncbi:YTH domain-containing protein [Artemisia annua]|uniref:YTH domain-containing family protein n=1 Tax=Artemisia annua TaxID=35608 RepID=A0A2U1QBH5_ARTAN|nr:YTH domain-containing protein [Artemisia annua]